jgi:hypothetical protein
MKNTRQPRRQPTDRRTLIRLAGAAPLAAGVPLAYAQRTEPAGGTPEQFAATLRRNDARWGAVVKDNSLRAD